jgi:guanosine-3',5'-bis(diphosphate) 3'-pyrophosphohydrolase
MGKAPGRTMRPLLEAVALAARVHQGKLRKDGATPYVSHVFRVCLILRHLFDIDDPQALTAAVLHDTLEDTDTDFDDLSEEFGAEVAGWVAALSKDKRLPEEQREQAYAEALARSPWQVQACKLADVYDNLMDSAKTEPLQRARVLKRAHYYLAAMKRNVRPQAFRPLEMVVDLVGQIEADQPER